MKIVTVNQGNLDQLKLVEFDLVIASSGYEERSKFLSSQLSLNIINSEKLVIGFTDYLNNSIRIENDAFFKSLNFTFLLCNGDSGLPILKYLNDFLSISNHKILTILIDISSMTRIWYASIIHFLKYKFNTDVSLKVFFSYSCAEFYLPENTSSAIVHFNPVPEFCHLSIPSVPTALITGLGYETNLTFGLKEYFDAELVYLFYTDNNSFTEQVVNLHKELLSVSRPENVIKYELKDVLHTKVVLLDLCKSLASYYRIIIAPCGPKIFTLLSFIVASEFNFIDVWRISSDRTDLESKRRPNGDVIFCEVQYQGI